MGTSPLIKFPDQTLVIPPLYCGSVRAYAVMAMFGSVVYDAGRRFNKREKECHRCVIEGPNGLQRLTVPLEKPQQWHSTRLADVMVSAHGEWWHVHWGAIESAYGRTPFFEYYADALLPAFSGKIATLAELDMLIHRFCLDALGIVSAPPSEIEVHQMPHVADVPYYQIWASRFGFTPGLSVLDLIFNMGPESPLVLKRMADAAL
ncbi:MAG: WbqC family protein [Muribaculum sp.]|nr:WbqC family protein [Muribaculum sp.]